MKFLNLGHTPKTQLENELKNAVMYEQALQSNLSWTQRYFCIAGLIIDLPYEYFCGADGIWLMASDPLLAFAPCRRNL